MIDRRTLPLRLAGLLLPALFLATAAATSTPTLAPVKQSPTSGGYVVTVDASDIVVRRRDGKIAFSAQAFAAAQLVALKQARGADLDSVRHRFSIISLAGPFLALRDQVEINIASPIPGGSTRFWTIDLRQPATYRFDDEEPLRPLPNDKTLLDLRQFISPAALSAAIGATRLGAPLPAGPRARDLRYVLSDLSKRGMQPPNCFAADDDVATSFAVVGKTATRLQVRLGIPGQPSCRYALTALDIELPNGGPLSAAIGASPVAPGPPGTTVIDTPVRATR